MNVSVMLVSCECMLTCKSLEMVIGECVINVLCYNEGKGGGAQGLDSWIYKICYKIEGELFGMYLF